MTTPPSFKFPYREEWLAAAVGIIRPWFRGKGFELPPVRVSCGWPSARGTSSKKKCLGEFWDKAASADKVGQIYINPIMDEPVQKQDGYGVLPTLIHECIHGVFGKEGGHGKDFGRCARAVGLEGKLTATHAGEELQEMCLGWVEERLGTYPHVKLNPTKSGVKKQGTRMVKCECEACGYVVRTTSKWLDSGAPICPCNKEDMKVILPEEVKEENNDKE